jgi:CheY-like chemotaxis protein
MRPVTDATTAPKPLRVLVYSDDGNVREDVMLALGPRPHPDLPRLEYVEVATEPAVLEHLDTHTIDLAILDGEAVPAGGIGIARQLKDEYPDAPPCIVVIARAADRWLAAYARVEATLVHRLDPVLTGRTVAEMLRQRAALTS